MNILIIGQCTLQKGRMEFGNIGNYYIIEPFIREIHKVFPNAKIKTTMQMSNNFQKNENVKSIPISNFYEWTETDLSTALEELAIAEIYSKTNILIKKTSYIKEVLWADLVINFSGDMWGDNANFIGKNRFLIGLIKDRVPQLMGKKTVMLAGSPGPFKNQKIKEFAKEVYKNFDIVTNREPYSTELLKDEGFDISKTTNLACPAFLFETTKVGNFNALIKSTKQFSSNKKVGFIICGWNFTEGPFDKENRNDSEFMKFVEAVEYISTELKSDVFLMSHSNGFPIPPKKFKLTYGRDFYIAKKLYEIIINRNIAKNVHLLDSVYDSWKTKAILGCFDMLISGRVHGAVGGLSQNVPTVFIDYGHEPKAHKIIGFARVAGVEDYVADPSIDMDIIIKIKKCWENRVQYKEFLEKQIPKVKLTAQENFLLLKELKY